jgi:hypothetical protein
VGQFQKSKIRRGEPLMSELTVKVEKSVVRSYKVMGNLYLSKNRD